MLAIMIIALMARKGKGKAKDTGKDKDKGKGKEKSKGKVKETSPGRVKESRALWLFMMNQLIRMKDRI